MAEKRNSNRREFTYYMPILDVASGAIIGHLTDISEHGFRIDTKYRIPVGNVLNLRLNLGSELTKKGAIFFQAQSRWSQVDPMEPTLYNVGFEVTKINPEDDLVYQAMVERYSKPSRRF